MLLNSTGHSDPQTSLLYSIDHPDPEYSFIVTVVPINKFGAGQPAVTSLISGESNVFEYHFETVCSCSINTFSF